MISSIIATWVIFFVLVVIITGVVVIISTVEEPTDEVLAALKWAWYLLFPFVPMIIAINRTIREHKRDKEDPRVEINQWLYRKGL